METSWFFFVLIFLWNSTCYKIISTPWIKSKYPSRQPFPKVRNDIEIPWKQFAASHVVDDVEALQRAGQETQFCLKNQGAPDSPVQPTGPGPAEAAQERLQERLELGWAARGMRARQRPPPMPGSSAGGGAASAGGRPHFPQAAPGPAEPGRAPLSLPATPSASGAAARPPAKVKRAARD